MNLLQRTGTVAGIAVPVLAAVWWAGTGYMEFNDRLAALERDISDVRQFRVRYEREQAKDDLVNTQVEKLAEQIDWLRFHHHTVPNSGDTGIAHVD